MHCERKLRNVGGLALALVALAVEHLRAGAPPETRKGGGAAHGNNQRTVGRGANPNVGRELV